MLFIPAIDIRNGAAVLSGSRSDPASGTDVLRVVRDLGASGFTRIHVVDLDAASGAGSNALLVRDVLQAASADFQVGGGLKDADGVRDTLDEGALFAVVAARSLSHLDQVGDLVSAFPGEVILSVACRDRRVEVEAWPRSLPQDVLDLCEELAGLPLAALLLRAIDREGAMAGPDYRLAEDAVEASEAPVYVAGGIGSIGHLRNLEDRGVSACVAGTALHAGLLHAAAVAGEFAS